MSINQMPAIQYQYQPTQYYNSSYSLPYFSSILSNNTSINQNPYSAQIQSMSGNFKTVASMVNSNVYTLLYTYLIESIRGKKIKDYLKAFFINVIQFVLSVMISQGNSGYLSFVTNPKVESKSIIQFKPYNKETSQIMEEYDQNPVFEVRGFFILLSSSL